MVWINGKEYLGAQVVQLNLDSEVQKHPVEKGFSVADNIKHETPQFLVSLVLGGTTNGDDRDTEYSRLKELYEKGTLFTFICDLGSFDEMVIKNLSPAVERSKNTYSCELTIVQVRQATLVTQYFTITDKDGKELYSPVKPAGTPPTTSVQEKSVDAEPAKESGKSWLSSIIDWVGGLFG